VSLLHTPLDPTDLDAIRRALDGTQPTGGRHPIGIDRIVIGIDALGALPAAIAVARGQRPGPVVVLMDATPMRRGPDDLKDLVTGIIARHAESVVCVLGRDRPELHADERALAEADAAIVGAGCVVSVGSGTVTDIAKDATFRAGIPFVAVQTAVSVNAFSDDMAVLLRNGVKRTVPSHWPRALIVDLETIAGAPPVMNQAGFGELMTMFTAPADWYLATAVGADDSFDPGVVALYRDGADRLLEQAPGVAAASHEALAELARQMTLTGLAMGVAGRTAPLSGTEHTVSHLLDMTAERDGRALAFHGAQVGVAAVIVALAWRRLLRDLDPVRIAAAATRPPDRVATERRVHTAFGSLDASGRAAEECWRDVARKLDRWESGADRIAGVAAAWEEHREALGAIVLAPERIVAGLTAAGAPTRFSELDPAPPPAVVRWAIGSCHLMRDRFTVADLIDLTGGLGHRWDEEFADDLLAEAAGLGAGL
jgi:glycerol-1-phosphate dehydrogenase [NAD(P)+]